MPNFSSIFDIRKIWSAHTEGETPVPIPNTAVKPLRADGSVLVRVCESRSVLLNLKGLANKIAGSFFIVAPIQRSLCIKRTRT